jgi:hypothetical protein
MSANTTRPDDEYWKFADLEQHFNGLQADIRGIASTWILAAFGAIAVLLKVGGDDGRWAVPPPVLVCAVDTMAILGLLVLWINDQLVYQRLLDAGFIIGLRAEWNNSQLPPVRLMMMYSAEGAGMSRWMSYYYKIPMIVFFIISLFAIVWWLQTDSGTIWQLASSVTFGLVILMVVVQSGVISWMARKRSAVGVRAIASAFEGEEFVRDLFPQETGGTLKKLADRVRAYR